MSTAARRDVARRVKSTGWPGLGTVNVAVTGATVPEVNAGTLTFAFEDAIAPRPISPLLESFISTVTDPGPAVIDWNAAALPGNTSVTVNAGVHVPPGVGVGVGVGFGVGVGVGVGPPPPAHCARIRTAFCLEDARSVKSTACPGDGMVNVAATGLVVPFAKAGIVTFALVALTTVKP